MASSRLARRSSSRTWTTDIKRVVAAVIEQATSDDAGRAMDGLRRVVRALRTGNVQAERTLGISSAQLFALRAIAAQPGGSLRDLAERTLTSQSSVSEVVARLAARRLTKRVTSPEDRRRVELTVTDAGNRLLEGAPATVQEQLAAGLKSLSPAQRRNLADGIEAWMAAAGLSSISASMFFEDAK